MFYPWCILFLFFSFFSPRLLRAPSTDRPETLPHGRNVALFYNSTPKVRRARPQKKFGAKNMQNFGQFWTTSDFDRKYLRNGSRYPKLESQCFQNDSSCVQLKRSGELWSTNYRDLDVSLDPLKCTFLAPYYISTLRGCCALKFFTRAIDWPSLASAHSKWAGGPPPKNCNHEN